MEIKKDSKFNGLIKRIGAVAVVCVFCLAIALTIAFSVPKGQQVSNVMGQFVLPMNNATVVKDYADDRLQDNPTLKRWEIHLAIDLQSNDMNVFSIYDGVVKSIRSNGLEGKVVEIDHGNGFTSVYSSLENDVNVQENGKVNKGQQIGKASNAAGNEKLTGGHLHFMLYKDGKAVDPNIYLDLQNK